MGQIIRFPFLSGVYPSQSTDLDGAEAVLLIGLRWWVEDARRRQDPLPRLRHGMDLAGIPDAAASMDALMSITAREAQRPPAIHGPCCDCLSLDETHLLHAASLAQAGDSGRAERVLRTALLTAQGAEMALGPLHSIGRLFSAARLLLRRRSAPGTTDREPAAALH
jgi:hypothetical protein